MREHFILASVIALGCSSGDDTAQTDAASDVVAALDVVDASTTIDIPASSGSWTVAEDVSFNGKGAGDLGAIALTHGVGTIAFKGETVPAFFFTATSTPTGTSNDAGTFANERDFEIIGLSPDRIVVAWITCANTTDLGWVFYESNDGFDSATELPATGTCADVVTNITESITLPAVSIPPPDVVPGFTIDGAAKLSFDGTHAGAAQLSNESWALYPFNVIDCSKCATPGWYELHSLFYRPEDQNACIGILYLEAASPNQVVLAYSICLPAFTTPYAGNQLAYPATWTTP